MSDRSWLRKTPRRTAMGRATSIDTGSPVPHGIVVATCRVRRFIMTADKLDPADESWTALRRYGSASQGAPPRGRQLSARIISFLYRVAGFARMRRKTP